MSKTIRRLLKNFFSLTLADIVSKVFELLYVIVVGRYLGVDGFGIITFWLSFTVIINLITNLGFGQLMVREVARDNQLAKKYLGNNFSLKLILIMVFSLTTILVLSLIQIDQTLRISGYIMLFSLVLKTLIFDSFYTLFRSFEKMEFQGFGQIINSSFKFVLALIAIQGSFNIAQLSLMHLASHIITLVYCIIISILFFIRPRIDFDLKFIKTSLKMSIPFGLTGAFFNIYDWIEALLLLLFFSKTIVGYYNGGLKLTHPLVVFSMVISLAIFPLLARSYKNSKENHKNLFAKFLKYLTLVSVPISVLVFTFSEPIIFIVYGAGFEGSVISLQILSWTIIPIYIRIAFSRVLESSDRQAILVKFAGICVIINIILNFLFIYNFSYIGAGIAKIITILLSIILLIIAVYKNEKQLLHKQLLFIFLKTIAAGGLMLGISLLFKYAFSNIHIISNIIISSILAMLIYLILLIVFRVITREEFLFFKQAIKRTDKPSE